MVNSIKNIFPIVFRKRIKNFFSQFLPKEINFDRIDKSLLKEWQKNKSKKYDIIIFSIISWNYRFQRPQQLALQFAKKGHRVFYIDNEFLTSNSNHFPFSSEKINNNIFNISLSSPKNYFIYHDILKKTDQKYILNSIRNLVKKANIKKAVIKIDHPFWYQICKYLKFPIVYDCMDSHKSFTETSDNILEIENKLIENADLITVTSKYIGNMIENRQPKNFPSIIGNGVDFDYFSSPKSHIIPFDIKDVKHPIIGYYGAINSWMDIGIIDKLLSKRPDYNLVMIGRVENNKIKKLLRKHKNFWLLGEKPYSKIKEYLDNFDVCIIPFKINTLIRATDPVKFYEFLAAGKEIVSSKIPSIIKYKKVFFIFNNKKDILKKIDKALNIKRDNTEKLKIAYFNSWQKLADNYENLVNKLFKNK